MAITITMKRKWEQGLILEASCSFASFLNKLYEAILKRKLQRKLQHSMGLKKFTASLGHYTFWCGINISGVKMFIKIGRECEKLILGK